jgi:thioredoxin reductase (NADPH)
MQDQRFDVAVIGEGVAGLVCARAAAQRGLRVATFEAMLFGGSVTNVNELDPVPADMPAMGAELAASLLEASLGRGVQSINAAVTSVRRSADGFDIATDEAVYGATHVVVACGAARKLMEVPGERELTGQGVSQCADCDGPMYQDQHAVVVGGGDSALQEALALTHHCSKVYLVHRRQAYRAREHFVAKVAQEPKIEPMLGYTVTRVLGEGGVTGVTLAQVADGKSMELPCAAVFAYVGLQPQTDFLPPEVARDEDGYLVTDDRLRTSLDGVWAIGAVRSGFAGQIADAVREAEQAAAAIAEHRRAA